jgi:hypothetical protein
MKTIFIRVLAIATLATSISAFAVTTESRPADAAANCVNSNQAAPAQNTKTAKKEKKVRQDRKEQKDQITDQFSGIWG